VPPGATITSGQGEVLITVNFGVANSGNISVNAFSGCALSASSNLAITVNLGNLAAATGGVQVCASGAVSGGGTYYIDPSCNLIAKVVPSGATPVSGTINNCVIIDGSVQFFNAEPYVQRHYDIEPATNANNATATITLYFKDQEFVDFNANNSSFPDLPTVAGGGNSDPNISKLRVTQYHGVPIAPHNTGNPSPGYYSGNLGSGVLITPSLVYYNSTYGYWEVTLPVNGFSGFYVHTNIYFPLTVTLDYLSGTRQDGKHLLNWKVTCTATPKVILSLERSADARNFTEIYTIKADALRCQQPFDHTDAQPLYGTNFYRLRMEDADGKITYSRVINLLNPVNDFDLINIVPNPVSGGNIKLNVNSGLPAAMEILISDVQGRIMDRQRVQVIAGLNSIDLDVSRLSKGTYIISVSIANNKSKVLRFVKD
jgi:Secretion system C-terminal sorting domain/PKD-like domain